MDISLRLNSIASLVNTNENIVDIGCDHGLIDIYLTLNKNCKCKACDVNIDIVNRAINNIKKYDLEDKIDVFVGNGYNDLKIDYNSTIILSGMGTSTMLKILEKNRTKSMICQTNTDQYELRKGICDMGYNIVSEDIVFDNNRYYVTIRFEEGKCNYSYDEYLLGPILIKNNSLIFKDYVKYLYNKNISGYNKCLQYNGDNVCYMNKLIKTLNRYIEK